MDLVPDDWWDFLNMNHKHLISMNNEYCLSNEIQNIFTCPLKTSSLVNNNCSGFPPCWIIFSHYFKIFYLRDHLYGTCSNKNHSGIVPDKWQAIKNSPQGWWGRHPIDAPADGSPLQRTHWTVAGITVLWVALISLSDPAALQCFLEGAKQMVVTWWQVYDVWGMVQHLPCSAACFGHCNMMTPLADMSGQFLSPESGAHNTLSH